MITNGWLKKSRLRSASNWTAASGTLPNGKYVLYHGGRVWVAGMAAYGAVSDPGSTLVFSDVRDPRAWPAANVVQFDPNDVRLYRLQAQSHETLGSILLQHQALAEVYSRQGNYPAAIEQLQIALKTDDGDFYQMSSVEARLRELRELAANESKKK
jgi:hypothetical protein